MILFQTLCKALYRYYHLILILTLIDSIFSSISQMKRLRCKELKNMPKVMARMCQSQVHLTPKFKLFKFKLFKFIIPDWM